MVHFDSVEYWQHKTWDRFFELKQVKPIIAEEFRKQEGLTVSAAVEHSKGYSQYTALDLACGTGRISRSLLQAISKPFQMVLADFNPRTLKMAECNLSDYPNASFTLTDAYKIGELFRSTFDFIMAMDILHHVADPDLLMRQISLALKPGGVFVGNVFAKESYATWDYLKYGMLRSWLRFLGHAVARQVYSNCGPSVQSKIRRWGVHRIEPWSRDELRSTLERYFRLLRIENGYYYWFVATPIESTSCNQQSP